MERPSVLSIGNKVTSKNHYHDNFLAYLGLIFKKALGNFISIDKIIMLKCDSFRFVIKYVMIP